MDYLLLIYEDEKRFATQGEADFKNEMADYMNFGKEHEKVIKGSNALQPTSTGKTVRVRGGKATTTDGPSTDPDRCDVQITIAKLSCFHSCVLG